MQHTAITIQSLTKDALPKEQLLHMLAEEADNVPTLDYATLVEIRKAGYINSGELAAILLDMGFTQLAITDRSVAALYDIRNVPEGKRKARKIMGSTIEFNRDRRNLTRSFASYTGYMWGSGLNIKQCRAEKKRAESKQLCLPEATKSTPSKGSATTQLSTRDKKAVVAECSKYLYWKTKVDWLTAQQAFMRTVGLALGYSIHTDQEIAERVVNELKQGPLAPNITLVQLAEVINYDWRWLRADPCGGRTHFHLELTPQNVGAILKKCLHLPLGGVKRNTVIYEGKSKPQPKQMPTVPAAPVIVSATYASDVKIGRLLHYQIDLSRPKPHISIEIELSVPPADAYAAIERFCHK